MTELSEIPGTLDAVGAAGTNRQSIYVYEAPVRIWHWLNAALITLLVITGYLIASPLPSMPGEASNWYTMGYIRFIHFASGQTLAAAFLYRIYWAFVGNAYARQLFALPFYNRIWRWAFYMNCAGISFWCATRRNMSATTLSPTQRCSCSSSRCSR